MKSTRSKGPLVSAVMLFLAACSPDVTGPEPSMSAADSDPAGVQPAFTCSEQEERWIVVRGEGFSPLVVDTIDEEEEFTVETPTIRLIQRSDVDGAALDAGFEITLASEDGVEDGDVRWISSSEMHFRVQPDQELVPGVYDVEIENANGEINLQSDAFGVLPRPTLSALQPDLVCLAQGERGVILEGSDFLVLGDERPSVTIDDQVYEVTLAEGCRDLPDVFDGHQLCDALHIVVAEDQHEPGSYPVSVQNIEPAACSSTDDVSLQVVPAPTIAAIADNPICSAQFENTITLQGEGFLRVGELLPEVQIGDEIFPVATLEDCGPVAGMDESVESCATAQLAIPQGALASAGVLGVVLTNPEPAGCFSEEPVTLTVASPPEVFAATPQPICLAESEQLLTLTGAGFLRIDDRLPTIAVGMQEYEAVDATECEAVEIYNETAAVESCASLDFIVPQNEFTEGNQPIIVTNPETAACSSMEDVDVRFVAPPSLVSVTESFSCLAEGATSFAIAGDGFVAVGNELPAVMVGDLAVPASNLTDCVALDIPGIDARECQGLEFALTPEQRTTGLYAVSVINPVPAACTSPDALELFIAGPPVVASAEPAAFCTGSTFDGNVTLTGESFLVIEGENPTVTVNGSPVSIANISGCTELALDDRTLTSCTQLDITLAPSNEPGDLTIAVTNPGAADCGQSTAEIVAEPTPLVTTVTPQRICSAGGTIQIDGENFLDGLDVRVGGVAASEVLVSNGGTRVTATFSAGLPVGEATLSVFNPGGCFDSFETPVRVVDGPISFYVDPEVTWNGMSTQVTIYASGLFGGTVAQAFLVDASGNEIELAPTFDEDRPNTIQALIPEGILPEGDTLGEYRIKLIDDVACGRTSDNVLLTVVDDLTVAVDSVNPPFGHTGTSTSVNITAFDPVPDASQVQFEATPRIYLNPLAEDARATELSAGRFIDATELGGIVPEGLDVGDYEVIVINPDGSVGVAAEPFRVTALAPPLVDSVSPGTWGVNSTINVLVDGQNFRNPDVEVTCFGEAGAITSPTSVTVSASSETSLTLSVDTTGMELLSICIMRVTNPDEMTYGEYSPITVTNSNPNAGNFLRFNASTELNEARRGLSSFASAPARQARFLYAIGGDDGDEINAKSNGEFAALDRLGEPQEWNYLPYDLPAGRTLAQALRLDDFVYLVGGYDAELMGATTEVLRAQVLNPLEVPTITNVEFDFGGYESGVQTGFDPGVYYYRVAAVYADSDPVNPGGESLTSDPQPIRMPDVDGIRVTLAWTAPPIDNGIIDEYRIYRSATADAPYGEEQLLGVVPNQPGLLTFLDDGSTATDPTIIPLPLGALGEWDSVADLSVARISHGLASAVDPVDPTRRYIYAAGGDDDTALRNDYEFFTVTTEGPRKQTISATSTAGVDIFDVARAEFALLAANPQNANRLSQTFLFAMHGSGTNRVDVAEVLAGGLLGTWNALPQNQLPPGETRSGYAAAVANNQIILVGGGDGAKKNSINCSGCLSPTLNQSWTAAAQSGATDRILSGYASSQGFIYMIAGLVDNGGILEATRTTEYSVLGGTP